MGYLEAIPEFTGLDDVSGTCVLDVSSSLFTNLFSVELDVSGITDICANTLRLKINNDTYFQDISFSQFVITSGKFNTGYNDQRVYKDILRRLSYHVTGGNHAVDVFTNETQMSKTIQNLDSSLCNSLNEIIENYSSNGYKTVTEYTNLTNNGLKTFYGIGHKLLSFILDGSNDDVTSYTSLSNSIQNAYTNNGNSLPIEVPFSFSSGKFIVVRITYKPTLANFNPVPYKFFLKLT